MEEYDLRMDKKVAVYTLGCKVNQVESEQIKESFVRKGYQVVGIEEVADVYVINTCTVTHVSDRKSRAMLRRARRKNPAAIVVATGCFAEISAEQIAGMPEVDIVVGNQEKERVADLVDEYQARKGTIVKVGGSVPGLRYSPVGYTGAHERTRAFVKIQDGCESYCSYCIVPFTRGPVRSKHPHDVCREIENLVALGYREVVLTGIHTGMYGKDIQGWDVARLLDKVLDNVQGDYRLRLSSIEPLEISDELISLIEADRRLCRHLHIPLQSGSNRVLKQMNRRYTRDFYQNLVEGLVTRVPGIAVTSDVMVGFPTETEADFLDTLHLAEDLPFYDLHVFQYSPKPGTRAYTLSPQVEPQVRERRSHLLLDLADRKKAGFIEKFLGQTLTVLVEEEAGNGKFEGLSDNYIRVIFYASEEMRGEFVPIILQKNFRDKAGGVLCPNFARKSRL